MDLLQQFLDFSKKENLFQPKDKILIAVSGGLDSVVLSELFHRAGFKFGIAHCNFRLRGKESDKDELFVKALAKKYNVRFYSKQFTTEKFAKENKLTIQEAARTLRYEWFSEVCSKNNFAFTATAHHLNDSIETFFINLVRGAGISGLTGIHPATAEGIIRPLLFAERKLVEAYAKINKLKFREDSSNETDDYLRNKLRHRLIPLMNEFNPSFSKTMSRNLHNIFFADAVFNKAIIDAAVKMTHHIKGMPYFSRKELQQMEYPVDYLFEFLSPFHFNSAQVREIWNCRQSGKIFYSDNFRVVCDRDKIIFTLRQKQEDETHEIKKTQTSFSHGSFSLSFKTQLLKNRKGFKLPVNSKISCLDASLLNFPILIRKWKPGDAFYPLGMKHRKKISDFLVDNKLSIPEKENVHVVLSGTEIICIPGHRIDDRYKVTDQTKKVFRIDYLSNLK